MVKVNEIFASIQGEGPYVGYKQVFVRFCNCNLKCNYCDTEFMDGKDYNPCELADEVNKFSDVHSVSLTGGEPLLQTEFLKDFLPRVNKKIYLETNATLVERFKEVKPFIDIVSADIKLESATGIKDTYKFHDKFFEACKGVETFAKIVFNDKITDDEIEKCCELGKKYGIELILQPEFSLCHCEVPKALSTQAFDKFNCHCEEHSDAASLCLKNKNVIARNVVTSQSHYNAITTQTSFARNDVYKMSVTSGFCAQILDKFLQNYENVRLIPQVHKFLDVR